MADPLIDPDNRFHADDIEGVEAKLAAENWATGIDVLAQVEKAYIGYLGGDSQLAYAQLASLLEAVRRRD